MWKLSGFQINWFRTIQESKIKPLIAKLNCDKQRQRESSQLGFNLMCLGSWSCDSDIWCLCNPFLDKDGQDYTTLKCKSRSNRVKLQNQKNRNTVMLTENLLRKFISCWLKDYSLSLITAVSILRILVQQANEPNSGTYFGMQLLKPAALLNNS